MLPHIVRLLALGATLVSTMAFGQSLDLMFSCQGITTGSVTSMGASSPGGHTCDIEYSNPSGAELLNVELQVRFDEVTQNFNLAPALPDGVPLLTDSMSQTWQPAKATQPIAGSPIPVFNKGAQTILLSLGDIPDQETGLVSFKLFTTSYFPVGDSDAEISATVDGIADTSIQHTMRWNGTGNFVRVAPIPAAQADRKYIGSAYLEIHGGLANAETDVSLRVYLPYWDGVSMRSDDQFDDSQGHIPVIASHQIEGRLALVNVFDAPEFVQDLLPGMPLDSFGRRSAPTTGDNANAIIWYDPSDNTLLANPGVWWSAESLATSPNNGHGRWRLRWQGELNAALPAEAVAPGRTLPVDACVQSRESGTVSQGDPDFCVAGSTTITADEIIDLDTVHATCPSNSDPAISCHDETRPFAPDSSGRTLVYFNNNTSLTGNGSVYAQLPGVDPTGKVATLTRFTVGPGLTVPRGNADTGAVAAGDIRLFVSASPADYTGVVADDVLTRDLPSAGTTWEECIPILVNNQGVRCDLTNLTTNVDDITQIRVSIPGMQPHHQSLAESRNMTRWSAELQWILANAPTSIDGLGSNTSTANRSFGVKSSFDLVTAWGDENLVDAQTAEVEVSFTVTPSAGAGGNISPPTEQEVFYNATAQFLLSPFAGYQINSVVGTCGGSLNGNIYTTNPVTANCTVMAVFAENPTENEIFADGFE